MDVGVEIGKYRVVEHIGRGGMADVWSARDQQLNRMVAIKTIAHGLTQEVNPVALFKEEAQTIAQMEHPHILPIYDYGEFEGQLYIVMRYVAGGSLEDVLSRGPMPMTEVLRVAQAIGGALDYAHSRNIIHLDLKPPNVLLDSHSAPYLADFGLATRLDPEGKANNPGSGTLLYMAPEQLTAEVIDKRADLYSFCIMIFHMLTGELPYEASVPMAMKQLQAHEELPEIDLINSDIPAAVTDVLRKGTAVEPDDRPATLMEIVEEIREVLGATAAFATSGAGFSSLDQEMFFGYDDEEIFVDGITPDFLAPDILEATREAGDLYLRAHHNWGGGNGRFLMGVTNFMLMNDYYMNADYYSLQIDEHGKQLLLRGALEYDQEVEYWWQQLDDTQRRWVCLHALRSGNAPARTRAMYRLETLTDSSPPQIPKLVAQALQVETDEDARIAALRVLGTRSKLVKDTGGIDVQTQFYGRLLSTMTRVGVQLTQQEEWRDLIYTAEIDLLIAESALDLSMPPVADYAARTVGRMRSKLAANYIAEQQKEGRKGALRALALIRDEAPSLPPGTGMTGRIYAWLANTFRRMLERPMGIVWRYVAALVLAGIGFGYHVYDGYADSGLLVQARWANTIALGLVFGTIVAFVPIFAGEFSTRLRRFWPWWARVVASIAIGTIWGGFAWWSWRWFFLRIPDIEWWLVGFGGFGIALGYGLSALFRLRSWFAIPLTILTTYIPIYITFEVGGYFREIGPFQFDDALLFYWVESKIFTIALPVAIAIGLGGHLTSLLRDVFLVIQLYREYRASKRPMTTAPVLPTVPDVAKYAPHTLTAKEIDAIASGVGGLRGAAGLKTELDMNLGEVSMEEPVATELDVNQGREEDPDLLEKTEAVTESLNISTGLKLPPRKAATMHTELDINQGVGADDEADDGLDADTSQDNQSLNISTGLRLPPRKSEAMAAEVDVNQGVGADDEADDGLDADTSQDNQSLNISTGLKLPPRKAESMQTELDVNQGSGGDDGSKDAETTDSEEVRSPRFFAASQTKVDKTNMKTELDPNAKKSDEDETEVRSPRFFAAQQSQPKVSTDVEDDKDKSEAETEVRKPRFFAASEASVPKIDADGEVMDDDDFDSDTQVHTPDIRTPRFMPGNMETDVDAANKAREAARDGDSEKTTTQRMNVGTGLKITPRKRTTSNEKVVSDDDENTKRDDLDPKTEPDGVDDTSSDE